ncbi:MAG: lytic transglycosylase domain-containing protein [Angelakisella sp.]
MVLQVGYKAFYRAAFPTEYTKQVETCAEMTGLPQSLLYAVIRTESGFCEDAVSSADARGLMQLTPDTLSWIRYRIGETGATSPELLFEPEANIYYGARTLALLMDEFGTAETALAAYHAGRGNVKKWLGNDSYSTDGKALYSIPFADTDSYVTKVLATEHMYKTVYDLP